MLKTLWYNFVGLIQEMWKPWPDDPLMTVFNRIVAVVIVSFVVLAAIMLSTFAIMCIQYPIVLLYAGLPIVMSIALTYLIVHVKIKNDESEKK